MTGAPVDRAAALAAFIESRFRWMHNEGIRGRYHDLHSGDFEWCNSLFCVQARAALALPACGGEREKPENVADRKDFHIGRWAIEAAARIQGGGGCGHDLTTRHHTRECNIQQAIDGAVQEALEWAALAYKFSPTPTDVIRERIATLGASASEPSGEPEKTWACIQCGRPRTKAEGGNVFSYCEECWEKRITRQPPAQPSVESQPEPEPEPDEPDIRACRMCNGAGCNWCAESGRDR